MTDLRSARTASVIRLFEHVPRRELQATADVSQPEFDLGDDLDEVVIGSWLHLEWMADDHCWMRVGDASLNVLFSADGRVEVNVTRGFYEEVIGETTVHEVPGDG